MIDLRAHFAADPARIQAMLGLHPPAQGQPQDAEPVSRPTDAEHLVANLGLVFRDDMLTSHVEELVQLWEGKPSFASHTVNYTLSGRRLDIQLHGRILPGYEESWERVLVAIEDVTERENARRKADGERELRAAACSRIRRSRSGSRISAASRSCSTKSASAASAISASSPTCIRNSSRAA